MRRTLALFAVAVLSTSAMAHHRQTPPIVQFTNGGDNSWPRAAAMSDRLVAALGSPGAKQIFIRQRDRQTFVALTHSGDNDNPVTALTSNFIAWDSNGDLLGNGSVGRQVYLLDNDELIQAAIDPTGTSRKPSINGIGSRVAFESAGDLAGTVHGGISQVFVRNMNGSIQQVSRGKGASRNAAFGRSGLRLVFESTSNPDTGDDTGVSQIWLLAGGGDAAPITDGAGSSSLPTMSETGRLISFESSAALATDGHDTGVKQVFVYDSYTSLFRQLTDEPGGCHTSYASDAVRARIVAFVCGSSAYYTDLTSGIRYKLPIPGGNTTQAMNAGGVHFMQVTTTANLFGGGTTAGHQLYQLNLFKLPGQPVAGNVVTFRR